MGIRGYTFTKTSSKGFDFSCGLQFEEICCFSVAVFPELFAFSTSVNFISTDDHELAGGGGNSMLEFVVRNLPKRMWLSMVRIVEQGNASTRQRAPFNRRSKELSVEFLEGRIVPAGNPLVGMNLESVVDWSPAWSFTDAFKASRPWISHAYNTVTGQESWEGGGTVHVDAKGWPTQLNHWNNSQNQPMEQRLGTLMFRDIGAGYPVGTYRAEWKGEGDVSWGFAANAVEEGTMANGTHYAMLNVSPDSAGIYMKVAGMSSVDPIRDIHVWLPDNNGQQFSGQVWQPGASFSPFHPRFLERLNPFSTIRFMDWAETNSTDVVNWSDRRPYDYATQQSGEFRNGVAPEYMVELCNEIDANAWVNMPHMATDDYVRNFATLVRNNLEPGRKVYVEWSNETWNGGYGFEVFPWVTSQLARSENAYLQGDRWAFVARETKRDFDIWSDVFAGQSDRLVRVVAGQQANSWIADQIISHMDGHFDAVSCSAYLHLGEDVRAGFSASTTTDQVMDALVQSVPTAVNWMKNHQQLAAYYSNALGRSIEFVAYEGGPHLDGQNGPYQPAFFAAGSNPRMYEIYSRLLEGCQEAGLNEFLQFSFTGGLYESSFGSFGALQSMEQPISQAPKYRALLDAATGDLYQPRISIEVASAGASENGPAAATIRVLRSGSVAGQLSVPLQVGGTADASDYLAFPSVVDFGDGETAKIFQLIPVDDAMVEGTEQVVVTLLTGSGYRVDSTHSAITLSILDNDFQSGAGLRAQYFDIARLSNPKIARVDQSINFNWGTGSPHPVIQADRFVVRWTGWIQAIEAGQYQFRTYSDDGVRLVVNGNVLINNWTAHAVTFDTATPINLAAGQRVPIQLDYFEATGSSRIRLDWRRPGKVFAVVPAAQLAPQNSGNTLGQGLRGQYFDVATQNVANTTRADNAINFNWRGSTPVEGFSNGPFVVRWTGWVQGVGAGNYLFRTISDDGVRLWVNGVLRINNPANRTVSTNTTTAINIPVGQKVQVKLEYYGYTNKSLVRLEWRRPGTTGFSVIPGSQLFPSEA